jgi:hypothetical protein
MSGVYFSIKNLKLENTVDQQKFVYNTFSRFHGTYLYKFDSPKVCACGKQK